MRRWVDALLAFSDLYCHLRAQFNATLTLLQGTQGPRGITGVPGPKGEAVSFWAFIFKICPARAIYGIEGCDSPSGLTRCWRPRGYPGDARNKGLHYFTDVVVILQVVVLRCRALLLLAAALASVFPLSDSPHREASGRQALPERLGLRGFLWVWPFILNCQDWLWTRSSKPTRNHLKRHRSALAAEQHVCWSWTNNNLQVK